MATTTKVTQKELKRPDRFRRFVADLMLKVQKHFKNIVIVAIGIVFVFAAILITRELSERDVERANYEFQQIIDLYDADVGKEQAESVLEQLAELIENYSNTQVAGIALYYSVLISFDIENYEDSIAYSKLYLASGNVPELLRDQIYLTTGLSLYNSGKWNEAIQQLRKVDKKGSSFSKQARLHIALSYEKMGEQEKADALYEELLKEGV